MCRLGGWPLICNKLANAQIASRRHWSEGTGIGGMQSLFKCSAHRCQECVSEQ